MTDSELEAWAEALIDLVHAEDQKQEQKVQQMRKSAEESQLEQVASRAPRELFKLI